jgi:protein gp37
MHPDWARTARDWANANHIAFHFKQWGEWLPYGQEPGTRDRTGLRVHEWTGFDSYRVGKHAAGRTLDGRTWDEFPVKDDGHA